MQASVYDQDNNGQVDKADDADKLGGQLPAYYRNAGNLNAGSVPIAMLPTGTTASTVAKGDHVHTQYLTTETDPTVPAWAKATSKPGYSAAEVNAVARPASYMPGNVAGYADGALLDLAIQVSQLPSSNAVTVQKNVYISPTGSDDNTGNSLTEAMATLTGVMQKYGGCMSLQVFFAAGDYDIGTNYFYSSAGLITLRGYPSDASKVILRGYLYNQSPSLFTYHLTLKAKESNVVFATQGSRFAARNCVFDGLGSDGATKYSGIFLQQGALAAINTVTIQNCGRALLGDNGCVVGCVATKIEASCDIGLDSRRSFIFWGAGCVVAL